MPQPSTKTSFHRLFALVIALLVIVTQAGEPNLVKNGDFKHGSEHWKVHFGEPTETKYSQNHRWVEVERGAIKFTLVPTVAASEGVKAATPLIPVEAGAGYEFGCRLRSQGPKPKIILEGYRADPSRTAAGADQYPGYKRVYRAVIHPKNVSAQWSEHSRVFNPPERYQPTHVLIKLYAYLGSGDIFFTDVFLRKIVE
jgi:hypothetical protein